MAHVLIGTPMLVSNRAFVQTWYNKKNEDGSTIILSSSKYNETFMEQHADKTGKAVVANMIIQYTKITACEGGFELQMVSQMDPCGMIPGFLKSKMSARIGKTLEFVTNFLRTGEKPPPAF